MATIRIVLPFHLRNLAHVGSELTLLVEDPVTQRSVLDALEAHYPMLRGAIRDHETLQRRGCLRFVAWREETSHEWTHPRLPETLRPRARAFRHVRAPRRRQ